MVVGIKYVVLRFIRFLKCFSYSNLTSMVLQGYKRINFLQLRKWLTVTKYARWTTLLLFSCWSKVDNEWPRSRCEGLRTLSSGMCRCQLDTRHTTLWHRSSSGQSGKHLPLVPWADRSSPTRLTRDIRYICGKQVTGAEDGMLFVVVEEKSIPTFMYLQHKK